MSVSSNSERAALSTEIGFAVVGGVASMHSAPGRVGRHVLGQFSAAVQTAHGAADFCTSRVVELARALY